MIPSSNVGLHTDFLVDDIVEDASTSNSSQSKLAAYRSMMDFLASSKVWREKFNLRRDEITERYRVEPLPSYLRVPRGCRR